MSSPARPGARASPSAGTLTFVFTDIEGSTRLLGTLGPDYDELLRAHDEVVRTAAEAEGGRSFGSEGDAQHLVFTDAGAAVRAAVAIQRELATRTWPADASVRVRMGIHAGEARHLGDDFVGMSLHETARISAAGHGGQILLSAAAAELARGSLPHGITLDDLGEHGLKDIERPVRIFQVAGDGLAAGFPALRTLQAAGARLPAQVTAFVGRPEIEMVVSAITEARLVTLSGPGGTGKTRLSIEVAAAVAPSFRDGTYFVALDAIEDPDLVASAIATTLAIAPGSGSPYEWVAAYLAERSVLLVLDNLEQVIDAADTVSKLLSACPQLHVLATSRIVLGIYGERNIPVPPLPMPPAGSTDLGIVAASEAVRLFVERAMAARPDFMLSEVNAPAVADIVNRVDGLPLAIELAAARVRMLPVEALRDRLHDRLGVLTGGARDLPARQRTLRGAIEWSHELLDGPDRRLFARFSVFAGGATLEHAELVCGPPDELGRDVFDGIESLSEQSLLRVVDEDGAARCAMLATIREFAAERLKDSDEAVAVHRRHAEACLALVEEAAPHLLGPEGPEWGARIDREHDNIRSALDWIVRSDEGELGTRLIAAIWRFWQGRGHLVEAGERIEAVLALPSVAAQDAALRSRALSAAGGVSYWRGRTDATHRYYAAALEAARETTDRKLLADALYDFGFAATPDVHDQSSRYRTGLESWQECLAIYQELDDRQGIASATWALAMSVAANGDEAEGRRLAARSLELSRELGDPFQTAWAAHLVGLGHALEGEFAEAGATLLESLELFDRAGDTGGLLLLLMDASALAERSERERARWRFIGAALRIRDEAGVELFDEASSAEFFRFRLVIEPDTDEQRDWIAEGRALSTEQAVESMRGLFTGVSPGGNDA